PGVVRDDPQARSAAVRAAPSQAAACLPSAARPAAPIFDLPRVTDE
ncbi:hypothetical protein ALO_18572, partial [Acetonema longum DSM 6540]